MDGFYADVGSGFLKSDRALFECENYGTFFSFLCVSLPSTVFLWLSSAWLLILAVMCYVAVFGRHHFEQPTLDKIVRSLDPMKSQRFYQFFFTPTTLNGWIHDQWCLLYDDVFVRDNLLDPASAAAAGILGEWLCGREVDEERSQPCACEQTVLCW